MKKVTVFALLTCFVLGGSLSADAAETRAAACAQPNCPGFLITREVDIPKPDHTTPCYFDGCIVTFSDKVEHTRITCCSECEYQYGKGEVLWSRSTQTHSIPLSQHSK